MTKTLKLFALLLGISLFLGCSHPQTDSQNNTTEKPEQVAKTCDGTAITDENFDQLFSFVKNEPLVTEIRRWHDGSKMENDLYLFDGPNYDSLCTSIGITEANKAVEDYIKMKLSEPAQECKFSRLHERFFLLKSGKSRLDWFKLDGTISHNTHLPQYTVPLTLFRTDKDIFVVAFWANEPYNVRNSLILKMDSTTAQILHDPDTYKLTCVDMLEVYFGESLFDDASPK